MSKINKQIISVSTNALYNKAKKTGYLNLDKINELYLYNYYLNFTKQYSKFNNEYQRLRNAIFKLRTRLDNICDYKSIIPNLTPILNIQPENTAPIMLVEPYINLNRLIDYRFEIDEFDVNNEQYFDNENNPLNGVYFYISQVTEGTFSYDGNLLTNDIFVRPDDLGKLIYTPDEGTYIIQIPFRVQDVNVTPLFSTLYNFTIDVDIPVTINKPSTIGDITLYPNNRETTVFTLDMFTTSLTPPYNDPEGDLIDAIRIDEISTANQGVFYYNNSPIVQGLIISKQDIVNGLFEHRAANTDNINSDVFNFSARDEGSLIWVQ